MHQYYTTLTGHSDIFSLSGMYRDCGFGDHGIPARTHHMQACWYSMHRHGIYASLSGVPCVHTASGYPAFSTDAASVFSFRISSHAFPGAQRQSGLHGSPPHSLRLPLRSSFPVLYSGVLYKPIFPVTCRSMSPLESPYPSQCAVQPVFFTGEIDEPSPQDSSV